MTPDDLLPPNATPLERSLSVSTDLLTRLACDTEKLAGFKSDPADSLLPWLIWEYGLGELLPYLPEPRQAIAEGIRWQRLRGTPAALTTALSWIGATATV
jgi:P2-related tail formation protein